MTSDEWWSGLLQGSVASVLSLIGLFAVFWLTKRHELTRDAAAAEALRQEKAAERTAKGVTQVVSASLRLRYTSEQDGPINLLPDVEAVSRELTMFSVAEAREHPSASLWAYEQSSKILDLYGPDIDIRAAVWQAGYVSAGLTGWVAGGFKDGVLTPSGKNNESKPRPSEARGDRAMTPRALASATREVASQVGKADATNNDPSIASIVRRPVKGKRFRAAREWWTTLRSK